MIGKNPETKSCPCVKRSTWLQQHQLDPYRIPVDSQIIVNDTERNVTAEYITLGPDGRAIFRDDHLVCEYVVRRLESPALPCPSGLIPVAEVEA